MGETVTKCVYPFAPLNPPFYFLSDSCVLPFGHKALCVLQLCQQLPFGLLRGVGPSPFELQPAFYALCFSFSRSLFLITSPEGTSLFFLSTSHPLPFNLTMALSGKAVMLIRKVWLHLTDSSPSPRLYVDVQMHLCAFRSAFNATQ